MTIVAIYNELVLLESFEQALPYWESTMSPTLAHSGYKLTQKQGSSLQYTRRITPAWTIVLAIFLFPLGLLALLSKQDSTLIITFERYGDGTMVKISGNGSKKTKKWLDEMTDAMNEIVRADQAEDSEV